MRLKFPTMILCCVFCLIAKAQYKVVGNFNELKNQQIKLIGFNGTNDYLIDSVKISENGLFILNFTAKEKGIAYLSAENDKPYFLVLDNESVSLEGEMFKKPETIKIISGVQQKIFSKFNEAEQISKKIESAWLYLQKMYSTGTIYASHKEASNSIAKELQFLKRQELDFINSLSKNSFNALYFTIRKLIFSISFIVGNKPEDIPKTIERFREINYSDERIIKSGLLSDLLKSQFWLIENSGLSDETAYVEMSKSIDSILFSASKDQNIFNIITDELFKELEKRSLFKASEYLAIKALSQNTCELNSDISKKLETYRAMKLGNKAADILFTNAVTQKGIEVNATSLSALNNKYNLVVFGASWCPKCTEEIPQISQYYNSWKEKGVDVLFISLDTEKQEFQKFSKSFPFYSTCEYKKWDSRSVKDFYVIGTPTMYLLDRSNKIILRPISVKQVNAFINYSLK
jgi:thiol-disulfide isomerase/thioredoxin